MSERMIQAFWVVLSLASVGWYLFLLIYVGWHGAADLLRMLRELRHDTHNMP